MYCGQACQTLIRKIVWQRVVKAKRRLRRTDHRSIQNYGGSRALAPDETEELRRRRREGWHLEHLARAYGVSTRTILRYLAAPPPVLVTVEGWSAWFVISHRDKPLQVSAWEPVA